MPQSALGPDERTWTASLRDGYPPHESEISLYVLPASIGDDELARFADGAAMGVVAATVLQIDLRRAPPAIGPVTLGTNAQILVMEQRNRRENGLYQFAGVGKPLTRVAHSACKEPPAAADPTPLKPGNLVAEDCKAPGAVRIVASDGSLRPTDTGFHVKVAEGPNAGMYLMRTREGSTEMEVTRVVLEPAQCAKPSELADGLKQELRGVVERYAKRLTDETASASSWPRSPGE